MQQSIRQKLFEWRADKARREGVEAYRVLANRTLEEIIQKRPKTSEELLGIYGIGEKKEKRYGKELMSIVEQWIASEKEPKIKRNFLSHSDLTLNEEPFTLQDLSREVVSVGEFLDRTNAVLAEMPGAVRGEVSSADIRERYVFFTIKDVKENASLSVFMWRREYDLCGVRAEEGVEVVVRGQLDIYKPSGRLSFRATSVELVGEGAMKAAYDRLKNQLEAEGLFAPERKKTPKEFPHHIGLITSKEGAVIHDFMSNIGKFGFHISFVNSRVEGSLAVAELLRAIRILRTHPIDVLVVIRGGGSLESLQAFNNEMIVREIADFPVPVICGIGHDKDVPLASLASDVMVSTPTAVTRELNSTWERLVARVDILERDLLHTYERQLIDQKNTFHRNAQNILSSFAEIVERCRGVEQRLGRCIISLSHGLEGVCNRIALKSGELVRQYSVLIELAREKIHSGERLIVQSDPRRQLRLGYSIVSSRGHVVRSIEDVNRGDEMNVLVTDGEIHATVKNTSIKILTELGNGYKVDQ